MAKYGTTNVLKIMAAMRTVPASVTENQAEKYVCSLVKKDETVGSDNVEFLYKFLSVSCSSGTLDRVVSAVRVEEELLGPPAMECYSCSRSPVFVPNNRCEIIHLCWRTGNGEDDFAM